MTSNKKKKIKIKKPEEVLPLVTYSWQKLEFKYYRTSSRTKYQLTEIKRADKMTLQSAKSMV